jgi:hypothetical protein
LLGLIEGGLPIIRIRLLGRSDAAEIWQALALLEEILERRQLVGSDVLALLFILGGLLMRT